MKLKVLAYIVLLMPVLAMSAEPDSYYLGLYQQANELYKTGNYDSAATLYSQIVGSGYTAPEVLYNLANCHYKLGHLAESILYYEKALRLAPGDADILHNLQVANAQIIDRIDPVEKVFFVRWWESVAYALTPDGWGLWSVLMLTLMCISLAVYFLSRTPSVRQAGFISAFVFLVFFGLAMTLGYEALHRYQEQQGIVFAPTVNVKSEPNPGAPVQFVIHEGTKVKVLAQESEWLRIQLEDGKTGWLPAQSIEMI
ncbi:MAG: hypothetical protein Kow0075_03350 [Salibacteraceae bacterium]